MKILFDANIWIDIAARPNTFPASLLAWRHSEDLGFTSCFPLSAYTSVYYVLKRLISHPAAFEFLQLLSSRSVKFIGFSEQEIRLASTFNFSDHEDGCVTAIAVLARCDLIITNNIRDFRHSPIPVLNPATFLKKY